MAKDKRLAAKGRRASGTFVPFPSSVLDHPNYIKMSSKAKDLLMDLCSQLRFKNGGTVNNGDLAAAVSILKERGWKSNESIDFAIKELLHYEFIILTRQGGRRRCNLYGVTWWAIDECKGKLDAKFEPRTTLNLWAKPKEKWKRPKRKLKSVPRFAENIRRITGYKTAEGDTYVSI